MTTFLLPAAIVLVLLFFLKIVLSAWRLWVSKRRPMKATLEAGRPLRWVPASVEFDPLRGMESPPYPAIQLVDWRVAKRLLFAGLAAFISAPCISFAVTPEANPFSHEIILVIGAPGEESYQAGFTAAAEAWREAAQRAKARLTVIGLDTPAEGAPSPSDRERLHQALGELDPRASAPVWLVYVGHGTFDRKQTWLNLRGEDVAGDDLAKWLEPLGQRRLIVVEGGSASGPLIPLLSAPGRIIITATRSGDEVNYARFGERFAAAVASPRADLDQDGATSLLEAFLQAAKEAQSVYSENGRMASEHALIDDNGDKLGTPFDWFQGVRVVKRPDGKITAADGFRAHQIALVEAPDAPVLTDEQRQLRDRLEEEIEALRHRRAQMSEDDYLRELETLLRKLAPLYTGAK